jgi:hypothetical protein
VTGWWFSPGTPVSSTHKTDHHDIAEILLKVALSTITPLTPHYRLFSKNDGIKWFIAHVVVYPTTNTIMTTMAPVF